MGDSDGEDVQLSYDLWRADVDVPDSSDGIDTKNVDAGPSFVPGHRVDLCGACRLWGSCCGNFVDPVIASFVLPVAENVHRMIQFLPGIILGETSSFVLFLMELHG